MANKSEPALASRRSVLKAGGMATAAIGAGAIVPGMTGKLLAAVNTGSQYRFGFLIDLNRCIGCKACAVACKTEFEVPLGVFRSSVKELDEGRFPNLERSFLPWLCNHCKNPVCTKDCPVDEIDATFVWPDGTSESYKKRATYQRPDGIVVVDQDRCVGCAACVDLCPYKARFLNPAKQTVSADAVDDHPADKCTLCVHRLEAGLVPACVNTCQTNARIIGDLNDPDSKISKIAASSDVQNLAPEKGTDPQCRYVALNPRTFSEGRDTR